MSFFNSRALTLALFVASVSATAGTITINGLFGPDGGTFSSPFTLSDGSDGIGGSWTGVGATVNGNDLSLYGNFVCATSSCSDIFTVDFFGYGFTDGTTAYVSVYGSGGAYDFTVQASDYAGNQSLGSVGASLGNSTFSLASIPVVVNNAGGFNGSLSLYFTGGQLNLPQNQTADLILSSVPEPGTLAIGAACILLLVYVKRLRKA